MLTRPLPFVSSYTDPFPPVALVPHPYMITFGNYSNYNSHVMYITYVTDTQHITYTGRKLALFAKATYVQHSALMIAVGTAGGLFCAAPCTLMKV